MAHVLRVYGPNLGSEWGADGYLLDDPSQAEIEDGYLTVRLPAFEGDSERRRKPTGPRTITYPPGQWSKTVVYEKVEVE